MLPRPAALIATAIALASNSGAFAQSGSAEKGVTVVASFRLRAEDWNWFDSPGSNDAYIYGGGFLRMMPRGAGDGVINSARGASESLVFEV